ncbi:uracil-DNA glycosylase [Terrihabitans sp. B22-R8]|uniref:uracil-DNA glycosylase n=1 Tax=Terrihabitans sp. B22-R8 TaxID=3425128 RepID=UPI00403CB5E5
MFVPPSPDCPLCPRLVSFREKWRAEAPTWHNAPVPGFGPWDARLLIIGLAPGLQGANRTGRPFTGDWAGDLLYATMLDFGFARGTYDERPDDGLELVDARIVNAVRCVPPQNKPVGAEIATCRQFLIEEMAELGSAQAIIALGRIAHESVVRALGASVPRTVFGHAAEHQIGAIRLFDSYHCSRYNTNTGRLTEEMFRAVFARVREYLPAR